MHRLADVAGSMLSLLPSQQVSSAYNCPGHGIDDCDACPNRCPTYCPTETLIPCLGEACISAALAASAPLPLATTQATAHIPAQPPPAAVPLQLTPATLPSVPLLPPVCLALLLCFQTPEACHSRPPAHPPAAASCPSPPPPHAAPHHHPFHPTLPSAHPPLPWLPALAPPLSPASPPQAL